MAVGRLTPRDTRRRIGDLADILAWPAKYFAERVEAAGSSQTEYTNFSDPEALSAALRRFVKTLSVEELIATLLLPEGFVCVVGGKVVCDDAREAQVWMRWMRGVAAEHEKPLRALFEEAGIRRRFRGSILSRGADCPRVAELLATYAFDTWTNVIMVCTDRPLALFACEDVDVHLYSPDKAVLASGTKVMKRLGLSPFPGGGRPEPREIIRRQKRGVERTWKNR